MPVVALLSGGLDSATSFALAMKQHGGDVTPFHVIYGQRHGRETESARAIANHARKTLQTVRVEMPIFGSALTDPGVDVPTEGVDSTIVPVTYVPARNTFLLGLAASFAEGIHASEIWVGFNAIDYSGYPDCRPGFVNAINNALAVGMKTPVRVVAPIITKTKKEIVALAQELGVPLHETWSCYQGGKDPCGVCDSCRIREQAFTDLGMFDPAHARA